MHPNEALLRGRLRLSLGRERDSSEGSNLCLLQVESFRTHHRLIPAGIDRESLAAPHTVAGHLRPSPLGLAVSASEMTFICCECLVVAVVVSISDVH